MAETNVPAPKLVGIESQIRTDSSKYNDGTKQMQTFHEEKNTVENYATIIKEIGRAHV